MPLGTLAAEGGRLEERCMLMRMRDMSLLSQPEELPAAFLLGTLNSRNTHSSLSVSPFTADGLSTPPSSTSAADAAVRAVTKARDSDTDSLKGRDAPTSPHALAWVRGTPERVQGMKLLCPIASRPEANASTPIRYIAAEVGPSGVKKPWATLSDQVDIDQAVASGEPAAHSEAGFPASSSRTFFACTLTASPLAAACTPNATSPSASG
mmetsp:Transcript_38203/g.107958  ORF Transcript_38203/g.107958 Transcript_38203/m.107958 type:complete len:209 (+) Transcript_38203:3357-3983(+)